MACAPGSLAVMRVCSSTKKGEGPLPLKNNWLLFYAHTDVASVLVPPLLHVLRVF